MIKAPPQDFFRLCQTVGRAVPLWTQGTGGNLSWKNGHDLWIKPSGQRVDGIKTRENLSLLNLQTLQKQLLFMDSDEDAYMEILESSRISAPRPSMETGFHAILQCHYVLHFHSVVAQIMLHQQHVPKEQGLKILNVPFLLPGAELSCFLRQQADFDVYLLKNHGVILQSNRPEILDIWESEERAFVRKIGIADDIKKTQETAKAPLPFKAYFPDSVVFEKDIKKHLQSAGAGMFRFSATINAQNQNAYEIWQATALLYDLCPDFPEVPLASQDEIRAMKMEKHRRTVLGAAS